MKRIVCYSLVLQDLERRPKLLRQIAASIKSLRAYNTSIPIHIFAYGDIAELNEATASHNVTIHTRGSYVERLARSLTSGWQVLADYPLLHRFMNFDEISQMSPEQVLLLDCDTFFFGDVDILFRACSIADCYAREEHCCKRSPLGYAQFYLDEDILATLASSEGISLPLPFNAGILLLNNRFWERTKFDTIYLSYIWRFAVWLALNGDADSCTLRAQLANPALGSCSVDQALGIKHFHDKVKLLSTNEDISRAMQFPSSNRWILDEVALWFTFFQTPGFTYQDFQRKDVLLGSEFAAKNGSQIDCILSHYYCGNSDCFFSWLQKNDFNSDATSHAS